MIDVTRPIGALIKDAGLTQKEISARTGIKQAALSHWVNGKRRVPAAAYAAIYNECEKEILKNGKNNKNIKDKR